MEYKRFRQLLKRVEAATLDFKKTYNAFASGVDKDRANLVQDICAMANNGAVASYLVVGVSDDRRRFFSVENTNLTDERIQDLCSKQIDPPPTIRVHEECWEKAAPEHANKRFVIIQVGPHGSRGFYITRDLGHIRRGDVWIRRGSMNDRATPQEIARMLQPRVSYQTDQSDDTVRYDRLPPANRVRSVDDDLQEIVRMHGGRVYDGRIVIRVGNLRYVWRYLPLADCGVAGNVIQLLQQNWAYEHGLLLAVADKMDKDAFGSKRAPCERALKYDFHCKEDWGHLTGFSMDHYNAKRVSIDEAHSVLVLTLSHLRDTATLRLRFAEMLTYLRDADPAFAQVMREARNATNDSLRRHLRDGWLDMDIFSHRIDYTKRPTDVEAASTVLSLSAGRGPQAHRQK
ncbi:MAG: ATP-binding protein [Armatimonadia bacterium]